MLRAGAFVRRRLRWSAFGLATLLAVAAVATDADARGRRHRHHHAAAAESYEPSYSSIVVDANSGAVMQATNADSPRHPASLTKIMTLYLLFERLEAGKIKMSTEMPVSAHAAAQAPSKLGLKPGQTHRGGNRDPRHRHQIGQRRGGGRGRGARRQRSQNSPS